MSLATGIFYILIGFTGSFLNISVAVAISRDKTLQNHTYKFMKQLALSDMEAIIGIALLPGLMLLADTGIATGIIGGISCFMAASGYHMAMYGAIFTAFSRWVTIGRKHRLNQFLSGNGRVILYFCVWFFVHSCYSPFIFRMDSFVYVKESMSCRYSNTTISQFIQNFGEYNNYISFILTLFFNVMTWVALSKMRRQVITQELKAQNKQEIRLYVQCAMDNFVFLTTVLFVYTTIYLEIFIDWVMVLLTTIVLFHHFDCAIFYICFNRKVRVGVEQFARNLFRNTAVSTVTPVRSIPVRSRGTGKN